MQAYSAELSQLIQSEMVAGGFTTENEFLLAAVHSFAERRASIEAIERGLDDAATGRTRPWREAISDARSRHNLANNP
jgi:predicted transcriptional regulator